MSTAQIRFYEELNDFLPQTKRKVLYTISFRDHPSIKHVIEAERVPHTEVDLILINGRSVPFTEKVQDGDFISVYPVFESFDISLVCRLRPEPLRDPQFILDVHLGKLARYLRMLGFDSLFSPDYGDKDLVGISLSENRAVLTRDRQLLMKKELTRGYWIRSDHIVEQVTEVIHRFDLKRLVHKFSRCTLCNEELIEVDREVAEQRYPDHHFVPEMTFFQCLSCRHIYWQGSHCDRFYRMLSRII
ncbi:MAG: twitching motility protein PilT [Bacteroidetes bacterium]|nr:MAG: twitching motility protein PilT [Bacteroidota bacterium]